MSNLPHSTLKCKSPHARCDQEGGGGNSIFATSARRDMDQLRNEMATKDDLAAVKDELATVKTTVALHGWMLGLLIAGVAALVLKAFFGG